jgi:hypothetical protein
MYIHIHINEIIWLVELVNKPKIIEKFWRNLTKNSA